ncbi:MAG: Hint domain-containing protein, partial [Pseudomonadota bacterium]
FQNVVSDVQFRVNDVDTGVWQDQVRVTAFDADGNPVPVALTDAALFDLSDTDPGAVDNDTATSLVDTDPNAANTNPGSGTGSLLVSIQGPISTFTIEYLNLDTGAQRIDVTDVFFTSVPVTFNDTITGGEGDDTILGQAGDDSLLGGDNNDSIEGGVGSDTIDGEGGDDQIAGNEGADSLDGGEGVDTVDYSDSNAGVIVNLNTGNGFGGDAQGDDLANFENIVGSDNNDVLLGDDGSNSIDGGLGNDTLFGGGGGDTLVGGEGNDSIDGVDGDDSLIGGIGNDSLFGNIGSDTFDGGIGNDTLSGGGDQDTFLGEVGNESIIGGETGIDQDAVDYSASTASVSVVLTGDEQGSVTGAATGTDTFSEIEQFDLSDQNDTVDATADTGGITVNANAGDDTVEGGSGNDVLDGGADIDTYDTSAAAGPVTVDLNNETATGTGIGNDTVTNFENVVGTASGDNLTGNDGDNTIEGGGGGDTISGGGGPGDGNDLLVGGGGNDVFDINPDLGDDTIPDFTLGEDIFDPADIPSENPNFPNTPVRPGEVVVTNNPIDPTDPNFTNGSQTLTFPDGSTITIPPGTIRTDDPANQIADLITAGIVCFTRGTMIATPRGEVAIEDLSVGDKVLTRDNGALPVRWIGSRRLPAVANLAPIMIKAGAMGNDRDLKVSPQHRMLICDWRADLMFGEPEVLVAAKDLINGDTVYRAEGGEVEYWHILFDSHQIVTANGAPSESFHPGEQALTIMDDASRDELLAIFPELRADAANGYGKAARPSLKGWEIKYLTK